MTSLADNQFFLARIEISRMKAMRLDERVSNIFALFKGLSFSGSAGGNILKNTTWRYVCLSTLYQNWRKKEEKNSTKLLENRQKSWTLSVVIDRPKYQKQQSVGENRCMVKMGYNTDFSGLLTGLIMSRSIFEIIGSYLVPSRPVLMSQHRIPLSKQQK